MDSHDDDAAAAALRLRRPTAKPAAVQALEASAEAVVAGVGAASSSEAEVDEALDACLVLCGRAVAKAPSASDGGGLLAAAGVAAARRASAAASGRPGSVLRGLGDFCHAVVKRVAPASSALDSAAAASFGPTARFTAYEEAEATGLLDGVRGLAPAVWVAAVDEALWFACSLLVEVVVLGGARTETPGDDLSLSSSSRTVALARCAAAVVVALRAVPALAEWARDGNVARTAHSALVALDQRRPDAANVELWDDATYEIASTLLTAVPWSCETWLRLFHLTESRVLRAIGEATAVDEAARRCAGGQGGRWRGGGRRPRRGPGEEPEEERSLGPDASRVGGRFGTTKRRLMRWCDLAERYCEVVEVAAAAGYADLMDRLVVRYISGGGRSGLVCRSDDDDDDEGARTLAALRTAVEEAARTTSKKKKKKNHHDDDYSSRRPRQQRGGRPPPAHVEDDDDAVARRAPSSRRGGGAESESDKAAAAAALSKMAATHVAVVARLGVAGLERIGALVASTVVVDDNDDDGTLCAYERALSTLDGACRRLVAAAEGGARLGAVRGGYLALAAARPRVDASNGAEAPLDARCWREWAVAVEGYSRAVSASSWWPSALDGDDSMHDALAAVLDAACDARCGGRYVFSTATTTSEEDEEEEEEGDDDDDAASVGPGPHRRERRPRSLLPSSSSTATLDGPRRLAMRTRPSEEVGDVTAGALCGVVEAVLAVARRGRATAPWQQRPMLGDLAVVDVLARVAVAPAKGVVGHGRVARAAAALAACVDGAGSGMMAVDVAHRAVWVAAALGGGCDSLIVTPGRGATCRATCVATLDDAARRLLAAAARRCAVATAVADDDDHDLLIVHNGGSGGLGVIAATAVPPPLRGASLGAEPWSTAAEDPDREREASALLAAFFEDPAMLVKLAKAPPPPPNKTVVTTTATPPPAPSTATKKDLKSVVALLKKKSSRSLETSVDLAAAGAAAGTEDESDEGSWKDDHRGDGATARIVARGVAAACAARFAVGARLKTRLGGAAATLPALTAELRRPASKAVALVGALEREIAEVARRAPAAPPEDIVVGAALEAAESRRGRPPFVVAAFFRQNRGVCDEWLRSTRVDVAVAALRAGEWSEAAWHAERAAVDRRAAAVRALPDKAKEEAVVGFSFDDGVALAAAARLALGDVDGLASLRALRAAERAAEGHRRGGDNDDDDGDVDAPWWLVAAEHVAAGRHVWALEALQSPAVDRFLLAATAQDGDAGDVATAGVAALGVEIFARLATAVGRDRLSEDDGGDLLRRPADWQSAWPVDIALARLSASFSVAGDDAASSPAAALARWAPPVLPAAVVGGGGTLLEDVEAGLEGLVAALEASAGAPSPRVDAAVALYELTADKVLAVAPLACRRDAGAYGGANHRLAAALARHLVGRVADDDGDGEDASSSSSPSSSFVEGLVGRIAGADDGGFARPVVRVARAAWRPGDASRAVALGAVETAVVVSSAASELDAAVSAVEATRRRWLSEATSDVAWKFVAGARLECDLARARHAARSGSFHAALAAYAAAIDAAHDGAVRGLTLVSDAAGAVPEPLRRLRLQPLVASALSTTATRRPWRTVDFACAGPDDDDYDEVRDGEARCAYFGAYLERALVGAGEALCARGAAGVAVPPALAAAVEAARALVRLDGLVEAVSGAGAGSLTTRMSQTTRVADVSARLGVASLECAATIAPGAARPWARLAAFWASLRREAAAEYYDIATAEAARNAMVLGAGPSSNATAGSRAVAISACSVVARARRRGASPRLAATVDALVDETPPSSWHVVWPQLAAECFCGPRKMTDGGCVGGVPGLDEEEVPAAGAGGGAEEETEEAAARGLAHVRLARRVAAAYPKDAVHSIVVACREAHIDAKKRRGVPSSFLAEDNKSSLRRSPWSRAAPAFRVLRCELALAGQETGAVLRGSEVLVDELARLSRLADDRWRSVLEKAAVARFADAYAQLRRDSAEPWAQQAPRRVAEVKLRAIVDPVLWALDRAMERSSGDSSKEDDDDDDDDEARVAYERDVDARVRPHVGAVVSGLEAMLEAARDVSAAEEQSDGGASWPVVSAGGDSARDGPGGVTTTTTSSASLADVKGRALMRSNTAFSQVMAGLKAVKAECRSTWSAATVARRLGALGGSFEEKASPSSSSLPAPPHVQSGGGVAVAVAVAATVPVAAAVTASTWAEDGFARLVAVGEEMTALSSKTRPKKVGFRCADGVDRLFLLKGAEDVHIDERMMQLLATINAVVEGAAAEADGRDRRRATVSRYAVVPLGRTSGLIEWVPHTRALFDLWRQRRASDALTASIAERQRKQRGGILPASVVTGPGGNKAVVVSTAAPAVGGGDIAAAAAVRRGEAGATYEALPRAYHEELRRVGVDTAAPRSEWSVDAMQRAFEALVDAGSVAGGTAAMIDEEVQRRARDASEWIVGRRRFAATVGASSIGAYVLGLGDRHLDNVLLDTRRGVLVDVDWGVCLDAGARLRVPEIVPFRLTASIERALGPAGKDAAEFRRAAAFALGALRREEPGSSLLALLDLCCRDRRVQWRGHLVLPGVAPPGGGGGGGALEKQQQRPRGGEEPPAMERGRRRRFDEQTATLGLACCRHREQRDEASRLALGRAAVLDETLELRRLVLNAAAAAFDQPPRRPAKMEERDDDDDDHDDALRRVAAAAVDRLRDADAAFAAALEERTAAADDLARAGDLAAARRRRVERLQVPSSSSYYYSSSSSSSSLSVVVVVWADELRRRAGFLGTMGLVSPMRRALHCADAVVAATSAARGARLSRAETSALQRGGGASDASLSTLFSANHPFLRGVVSAPPPPPSGSAWDVAATRSSSEAMRRVKAAAKTPAEAAAERAAAAAADGEARAAAEALEQCCEPAAEALRDCAAAVDAATPVVRARLSTKTLPLPPPPTTALGAGAAVWHRCRLAVDRAEMVASTANVPTPEAMQRAQATIAAVRGSARRSIRAYASKAPRAAVRAVFGVARRWVLTSGDGGGGGDAAPRGAPPHLEPPSPPGLEGASYYDDAPSPARRFDAVVSAAFSGTWSAASGGRGGGGALHDVVAAFGAMTTADFEDAFFFFFQGEEGGGFPGPSRRGEALVSTVVRLERAKLRAWALVAVADEAAAVVREAEADSSSVAFYRRAAVTVAGCAESAFNLAREPSRALAAEVFGTVYDRGLSVLVPETVVAAGRRAFFRTDAAAAATMRAAEARVDAVLEASVGPVLASLGQTAAAVVAALSSSTRATDSDDADGRRLSEVAADLTSACSSTAPSWRARCRLAGREAVARARLDPDAAEAHVAREVGAVCGEVCILVERVVAALTGGGGSTGGDVATSSFSSSSVEGAAFLDASAACVSLAAVAELAALLDATDAARLGRARLAMQRRAREALGPMCSRFAARYGVEVCAEAEASSFTADEDSASSQTIAMLCVDACRRAVEAARPSRLGLDAAVLRIRGARSELRGALRRVEAALGLGMMAKIAHQPGEAPLEMAGRCEAIFTAATALDGWLGDAEECAVALLDWYGPTAARDDGLPEERAVREASARLEAAVAQEAAAAATCADAARAASDSAARRSEAKSLAAARETALNSLSQLACLIKKVRASLCDADVPPARPTMTAGPTQPGGGGGSGINAAGGGGGSGNNAAGGGGVSGSNAGKKGGKAQQQQQQQQQQHGGGSASTTTKLSRKQQRAQQQQQQAAGFSKKKKKDAGGPGPRGAPRPSIWRFVARSASDLGAALAGVGEAEPARRARRCARRLEALDALDGALRHAVASEALSHFMARDGAKDSLAAARDAFLALPEDDDKRFLATTIMGPSSADAVARSVARVAARLDRLSAQGAARALDDVAAAREAFGVPPDASGASDDDDATSEDDASPEPSTDRPPPDAPTFALRGVAIKLGGGVEKLGVDAQLDSLVDVATDPGTLCRMYEGWAPWI